MKKVLCAISGGVDSAVAAFLLKEKGFEVNGGFMKLFNNKKSKEAELKARKIAKKLKIPFYSFDFSKEFKEEIIDYFIQTYKEGRTPNPCVVCNKKMKFGFFWKKVQDLKMDLMATGHYVIKENNNNSFQIKKGKDKNKDQSYFLWQLSQKQLQNTLFPLGEMKKEKVKKIAKKNNLLKSIPEESQNICFIQDSVQEFLKKEFKNQPGEIVDKEGEVLGKHKGLWLYTIGQRKGIRISGGPFYVLKKDLENNKLIITKDKSDLIRKKIKIKNINWISGKEPSFPLKLKTQIRYRGESLKSKIKKEEDCFLLSFEKGQKAVSSGQSAVFYKNGIVLGGGIIC